MLPAISGDDAIRLLQAGKPVQGYRIVGVLASYTNGHLDYAVRIENCWVEELRGAAEEYQRPVQLINSHFVQCDFAFAHFPQGLTIVGCTFENYLEFQAGGHNQPGFPVQLQNNIFKGFVNFFDCWYKAEVLVEGNIFHQGTNLLGAPQGYSVQFDAPSTIQHNVGNLERNDEGGR
ncbi:hypothetical protein [Hymenobacter perfusus]|uniref:Right-handed parallel beta-helix repeat-containing protein n=1 Tax=Hymenobacter perfusus TaxID=1236770 RepID=A0A428KHZ6_9BACT|nr:hypothetical protein [Hymenobacter perfusus]RSK46093.1 hypothetical protein EI293_02675 [Hymenobacter perfusus]